MILSNDFLKHFFDFSETAADFDEIWYANETRWLCNMYIYMNCYLYICQYVKLHFDSFS